MRRRFRTLGDDSDQAPRREVRRCPRCRRPMGETLNEPEPADGALCFRCKGVVEYGADATFAGYRYFNAAGEEIAREQAVYESNAYWTRGDAAGAGKLDDTNNEADASEPAEQAALAFVAMADAFNRAALAAADALAELSAELKRARDEARKAG